MGPAAIVVCFALAVAGQDPAVNSAAPAPVGDATVTLPPALPSRPSVEPAPWTPPAPQAEKAPAPLTIPVEEPRRPSRPPSSRSGAMSLLGP